MAKMIPSPLLSLLSERIQEKHPLIQVIIGPRQVGKTSTVEQLIAKNKKLKFHYVSGDGISSALWIQEQWQAALQEKSILIIDEIQKIPNWSEMIKKLWDESTKNKNRLKCILLGSSSLHLNKGLSESLTGRFELIRAHHWDFQQSNKIKKFSLENYLIYGGYPGSYQFTSNEKRWKEYLTSSIVETVITKDILTQARVSSPGLFRQCFYIVTSFPAQVVSYNKILGQLQDKGNIDRIKYYLELFESAYLIKTLHKYSKNELRKKQSSPKIIPLAPSLATFHCLNNISDEYKGRLFEALVGAALVKTDVDLYYWAEGDYEVDFVLSHKGKIYAIEVKSKRSRKAKSLEVFLKKYPSAKVVFITEQNYCRFEIDPLNFLETLGS